MVLDQTDCQLLELGQPVRCVESTSHLRCVVLRADVFDRIGWLFDKTADDAIQDMQQVLAETSPEDWKAVEEWKAS